MKPKKVISYTIVTGMLVFIIAIGIVRVSNLDFFRQFQSFSVTIINQSDYDLVTIETGIFKSDSLGEIMKSDSRDAYTKVVPSGKETVIRPKLKISGEGGVYIKYTDSRGEIVQEAICSYTEHISGYSKVTVFNDKMDVDEKCM